MNEKAIKSFRQSFESFRKSLEHFLLDETKEAEIRELETREKKKEREDFCEAAGIPRRYWAESFDTFQTDTDEQRKARDAALAFAEAVRGGDDCNLLLLGGAGTGKTHLACAILQTCGGLYRLAYHLEDELAKAMSFSARETPEEALARYAKARLLVIDEAGREKGQDMLYRVINARYNERKPTVIVSNLNKAAFAAFAGSAAVDRLAGNSRTVELSGESYRTGK